MTFVAAATVTPATVPANVQVGANRAPLPLRTPTRTVRRAIGYTGPIGTGGGGGATIAFARGSLSGSCRIPVTLKCSYQSVRLGIAFAKGSPAIGFHCTSHGSRFGIEKQLDSTVHQVQHFAVRAQREILPAGAAKKVIVHNTTHFCVSFASSRMLNWNLSPNTADAFSTMTTMRLPSATLRIALLSSSY